MKKFFAFISNRLVKPLEKISTQRHLAAVRSGLLAVFPLSLIGSLFYLVATLPLPENWALQKFLTAHSNTILIPYRMTVVLVTLYMVVGVGANLAKYYRYNQVSGALVALACFLMTTVPVQPSSMVPSSFIDSAASNGLDMSWYAGLESLGWVMPQVPMSGTGMYVGAFSAIIGVETMRFSKWLLKKIRKSKVSKKAHAPKAVAQTMNTLLPILIVVLGLFIVRDIIGIDFHQGVIHLFDLLIRSSTSLSGAMIYVFVLSLFTFCGVIGFSVTGSAAGVAWMTLIRANQVAHALGNVPPNVAPLPFFHYFVWIGGTGATLSLVVLLCFSKSGYLKKLGYSCLVPSLANISQPVIYGVPIILNPYMLIPFILGPQLTTFISYLVVQSNFISRPYSNPSSSFPFFIGAFLSTGDWKAVVLALFNFAICLAIYFPFFKVYEKRVIEEGDKQATRYALSGDKVPKMTVTAD